MKTRGPHDDKCRQPLQTESDPADSQQENEALSSETTEIEFFQQPE